MSAIPKHVLLSAEIREQTTPEDKAAHAKLNCINLPLSVICRELGADYGKARRRFEYLVERKEFYGVGRPPLIGTNDIREINRIIEKEFKSGDCADYNMVRRIMEKQYITKIRRMSDEAREKCPLHLRKNYVYEVSKQYNFNTKTPTLAEKERNVCSTTATVNSFFENTFTEKFCEGVPPQLFLNADETSIEIGLPRKVIIPPNEKTGRKIDEFISASHISAMITLNVTGDDFAPFILAPLKHLPKDITSLVLGGKVTVGGSQNGWMTDECFEKWAEWLIRRVAELRASYNFDADQRAILLLDGHGTRNNKDVMEKFSAAKIDVVIFPPHMTHILQPFDKVIARPLKDCLSSIARAIIEEYDEYDKTKRGVLRLTQIQALVDAYRSTSTIYNCKKAFESCGLFPRCPDKILQNKDVKKSKNCFIQTELIPGTPIKISGLCITQNEVRSQLRSKRSKNKSELK